MKYPAIVFDLDGTLVDSREAIVGAATKALADLGHPAPDPERILALVGLPLVDVMSRLLPQASGDVPRAVDGYRAVYAAFDRATTRAFPGIVDLLERPERYDVVPNDLAAVQAKVAGASRMGG